MKKFFSSQIFFFRPSAISLSNLLYHVWVLQRAEHLEQADFSGGGCWHSFVATLDADLLESDDSPRHQIAGLVDGAVRPSADLGHHIIVGRTNSHLARHAAAAGCRGSGSIHGARHGHWMARPFRHRRPPWPSRLPASFSPRLVSPEFWKRDSEPRWPVHSMDGVGIINRLLGERLPLVAYAHARVCHGCVSLFWPISFTWGYCWSWPKTWKMRPWAHVYIFFVLCSPTGCV